MMIKIIVLFSIAFAQAGSSTDTAKSILEYMTLTYSQVELMKTSFTKKSTSMLLGSVEKTSGNLEYSKRKFRLEITGKARNIFIKGDKFFWHLSDETVVKGDISKAMPTVFESIFSDPKIWSQMKSEIIKKEKDLVEVKVDTKGQIPNVKEMFLKIDNKKKTLKSLSYTDEVNNAVEVDFKKIRFFSKAKLGRFNYKVKNSDKVSLM